MFMRLLLTVDDSDGDNVKIKINLPLAVVKTALDANMVSSVVNIGDKAKLKDVDMNKIISQVIEMAEKGLMGNLMEMDVGGEDKVHMEFFVE